MSEETAPIKALPPEVAAQIKSSAAITSILCVIVGLVDNALDSKAETIHIYVDFIRGACTVEDDGLGIDPGEFREGGGLGKAFHTSKSECITPIHGVYGTFLASLSALSILTITSRRRGHHTPNTLILHHSEAAARLVPAPSHHKLVRSHGTRVSVQDLFGNMPVRVRQRAVSMNDSSSIEKEWSSICNRIVGTLLAWDRPVQVVMKSMGKTWKAGPQLQEHSPDLSSRSPKSFDVRNIRSLFTYLTSIDRSSLNTWVKTSVQTHFVTIRALISLTPTPSKRFQFISLGPRYVDPSAGNNILYEEINNVFALSNFGSQEDPSIGHSNQGKAKRPGSGGGFTAKQIKGVGKGPDKWPMFYIRIELQRSASVQPQYQVDDLEQGNRLSYIMNALRAMLKSFLLQNHFRPKWRPSRRPKHVGTSSPEPQNKNRFPERSGSKGNSEQSGLLVPTYENLHSAQREENGRSASRQSPRASEGAPLIRDPQILEMKLPKFQQGLGHFSRADFSGWSRIKSGLKCFDENRNFGLQSPTGKETFAADTSTSGSKVQYEIYLKPGDSTPNEGSLGAHHPLLPRGPSAESAAVDIIDANPDESSATMPSMSYDQGSSSFEISECDADDRISWTNPLTKSTILINARTGNSINLPLKNTQPTTVHSNSVHLARRRTDTCRGNFHRLGAPTAGSWVAGLLNGWENPVFACSEEAILQATTSALIDEGNKCTNETVRRFKAASDEIFMESMARLSRSGLAEGTVIAQVDKKFILMKAMGRGHSVFSGGTPPEAELLILIDQHAADERIRVEDLLADLCSEPSAAMRNFRSSLGLVTSINSIQLPNPIVYTIPNSERDLFKEQSAYFAQWGILYDLEEGGPEPSVSNMDETCRVCVIALPVSIAEKCRMDNLCLISMMRSEAWQREKPATTTSSTPLHSTSQLYLEHDENADEERVALATPKKHNWVGKLHDCPQGIVDMLNSRSCRSALMFNDELTLEDCRILVDKLAQCVFPFQCAHGRPSMIPLLGIGGGPSQEGGFALDVHSDAQGLHGRVSPDTWTSWIQRKKDEGLESTA